MKKTNNEINPKFINAYLHIMRESIETQMISIPTLFLGPFHFIYKKMYLFGLIYMIIYIFIDKISNNTILIVTKLLLHIILSLTFKYHYLKHAENEVKKIIRENEDKEPNEIVEICRKKGKGMNLLILFLIFIAYLIIITLPTNHNQEEIPVKNINNIIDKMSYTVPKDFQEITNEDNYKYFSYNEDEKICTITITTTKKKYNTLKEFINSESKIDKGYERNDFEKIKYNNNEWDRLYLESNTSKKDYYAIKNGEKIYEIVFESTTSPTDICKNYKSSLLNTVTFN